MSPLPPRAADAAWLEASVAAHGACAGTVHRWTWQYDQPVLVLRAAVNIPPAVQAVTATIPRGKGMAGLAWVRARPVSTCDLQTDETGDVRPGARAVQAQGAVALPVFDAAGAVRAVVGYAFADRGDPVGAQLEALAQAAAGLP